MEIVDIRLEAFKEAFKEKILLWTSVGIGVIALILLIICLISY